MNSRERFEAWAIKERYPIDRVVDPGSPFDGTYIYAHTREAWAAWQAAEAQVRAELTLTWTTEPPKVDGMYYMKWPRSPSSIRYICIRDVEDWEALKGVLFAGPIPEPKEQS